MSDREYAHDELLAGGTYALPGPLPRIRTALEARLGWIIQGATSDTLQKAYEAALGHMAHGPEARAGTGASV